ncbi:hypothetical protein [Salicibibacter cibarius]|uniref:hypothetical protein n=1 Tax=Salicibibacter cibarius TaxID=2743000 RepID=UPI001FE81AEE|nr:hypothetical protein [Salicibibacter cibarius]
MKKFMAHEAEVEAIFDLMVNQLSELLPDFGKSLAIDGKAVESFAKGNKKHEEPDGHRDTDADVGKKKILG